MAVVIAATSLAASPTDRLVFRLANGVFELPALQVVSVRGVAQSPDIFISVVPTRDEPLGRMRQTIFLQGVYLYSTDAERFVGEDGVAGFPPTTEPLRSDVPLTGLMEFPADPNRWCTAWFMTEGRGQFWILR